MSPVLLTFLSLAAYICGLVMLVKVTPHLLKRNFDEGFFMGIAAADILGGAEPAGTANALVTTGFAPNAADASLFISAGVIGIETP